MFSRDARLDERTPNLAEQRRSFFYETNCQVLNHGGGASDLGCAQSIGRDRVTYLARRLWYVSMRPRAGMTPQPGTISLIFS